MKKHNECCNDGCDSGLRNNYFDQKRLSPDSFRTEQDYHVDRRRLLNRAIHGWGVVYGYPIGPIKASASGPRQLGIGQGFALDECGRELLHTGDGVNLDDVIIIDEKGGMTKADVAFSPNAQRYEPDCWLLSVHYAELPMGLVKVKDSCNCEYDAWDQTCETVRFSLRRIKCDECCGTDDFDLNCKCGTSACCQTEDMHGRGGCGCLSRHLAKLEIGCKCEAWADIDERCGSVRVDLRNSVPLACVTLDFDDCDRWTFKDVETGWPRRLVKRNDLLFDLIRGCDLTRISEIGWTEWHRNSEPVDFELFSNAFGKPYDGQYEPEYISEKFWIEFSRPVRKNSLRRDCFAITIIGPDDSGGWGEMSRVPIVDLHFSGFENPKDPSGKTVLGTRIVVHGPWVERMRLPEGDFCDEPGVRIEIEVRGDYIVDCNGQTIDGNPRGLSPSPSGNGTPGGTYLSTFHVAPKPKRKPTPKVQVTADPQPALARI